MEHPLWHTAKESALRIRMSGRRSTRSEAGHVEKRRRPAGAVRHQKFLDTEGLAHTIGSASVEGAL